MKAPFTFNFEVLEGRDIVNIFRKMIFVKKSRRPGDLE